MNNFKNSSLLILLAGVILFNYSCIYRSCDKSVVENNYIENDAGISIDSFTEENDYSSNCTLRIFDLVGLLDKHIDSLADFHGLTKKKVVVEDEESYLTWYEVQYEDTGNTVFVAETNWINKNIVHRITLISDEIKENELVYIGQEFGKIKFLMDEKIPVASDGSLFLKMREKPEIFIQLDISNLPPDSPIYYGVNELIEIPDSLKVETIVIIHNPRK